VEEALRGRGLRFAPDALDELIAEVGQDLRRLMGEVDKLEAFAGDGGHLGGRRGRGPGRGSGSPSTC